MAQRPLRFGVIILQNRSWASMAAGFRYLEDMQFDSAWVADHFVNPYAASDPWLEGWTLLSGLAAITSRIRIGALVSSITLRSPAMLARQALTVDHISNGRLNLAIGAGRAPLDHSMTGTEPWEPRERARRFRETVEIVDHMLRYDVTDYEGQYYRVINAAMSPGPLQQPRPPLTIAAHGPVGIRITAQHADCWNSMGAPTTTGAAALSAAAALEATDKRCQLLDECCSRAGREPTDVSRSFLLGWTADRPFESLDSFADFVQRYQAIGIEEFIFFWIPEDSRASFPGMEGGDRAADTAILERLASELLPKLRGKAT